MTYYAYLHARPDAVDATGIFYVGKGKGKRAYNLKRDNRHHRSIVAKYGRDTILVSKLDCSSEEVAFELERGLIKCLRKMGVKLSNVTDGGDGVSGLRHTEITRQQMSKSHKKLCENVDAKLKMRDISKSRSQEVLNIVSQKLKVRWSDSEFRNNLVTAQTKAQRSLEITEFKREVARDNAAVGRLKLKDPAVKLQASQRNSEKSKAMWATPGFREKMAESRRNAKLNKVTNQSIERKVG